MSPALFFPSWPNESIQGSVYFIEKNQIPLQNWLNIFMFFCLFLGKSKLDGFVDFLHEQINYNLTLKPDARSCHWAVKATCINLM